MKSIVVFALLVAAAQAEDSRRIKLGAGFGNGFGMLGGGVEFEWHQVALLAGIGTFGVPDPAWDAGLRLYLRAADRKMRPHLTLSYAPTHVYKYAHPLFDIKNEVIIFGYNAVVGLDHDLGKPDGFAMTYGLGWATPRAMPEEVEKDFDRMGLKPAALDNVLVLAIGVKYQFRLGQ